MGKKLKRTIALAVVLVVLAAGGAMWLKEYVAPREALDLSYRPIDIGQKLLNMAASMEPELILTESDINQLMKMQIAESGGADNPDIRVDGARFELDDGELTAHMNVTYKDRLPVGMVIVYRLSWDEPYIRMEPRSVRVRSLKLPASVAESQIIELPAHRLFQIKEVAFQRDRVKIGFGIADMF